MWSLIASSTNTIIVRGLRFSQYGPGARFSKSRKLFEPEKPFVKLRPAYSVKLVFTYVVKGIKIKITAKFRASRSLRLEDTKRIMSPEMRPKTFRTFEKRAPDSTAFSANRVYSSLIKIDSCPHEVNLAE